MIFLGNQFGLVRKYKENEIHYYSHWKIIWHLLNIDARIKVNIYHDKNTICDFGSSCTFILRSDCNIIPNS